jgi:hypothetical protein
VAEWDEDALALLRAAVYRRDGDAGLAVLVGRPLGPVLQYAGDVLVGALERAVRSAPGIARKCVEELEGRGWDGDAELSAELTALLEGTPRALTEVPVDLGTLGVVLDADPAGGVQILDLRTGDIDPGSDLGSYLGSDLGLDIEMGDEPPHRLAFWPEGPCPDSSEERQRGRARRWLAAHGYRPGARTFL